MIGRCMRHITDNIDEISYGQNVCRNKKYTIIFVIRAILYNRGCTFCNRGYTFHNSGCRFRHYHVGLIAYDVITRAFHRHVAGARARQPAASWLVSGWRRVHAHGGFHQQAVATANLLLEAASLLETSPGGPSPQRQDCTSHGSRNQSTAACPGLPSATTELRSLFCRGTNSRKHKAPYLSRQQKKRGAHMGLYEWNDGRDCTRCE